MAALPFEARLCFAGLWTLADKEGRLLDKPKRIKAELFPYDEVNVDALLTGLHDGQFITRYSSDDETYIAIPKFRSHQHPHIREPESTIPAPVKHRARTRQALGEHQAPIVPPPALHDPDPSESLYGDGVGVGNRSLDPELESLSGVGVGDGEKSSAAETASPPGPVENLDDNVGVITKIVHVVLDLVGMQTSVTDLTETVKSRCAVERIPYNSAVVAKAIDSALVQRKRRA